MRKRIKNDLNNQFFSRMYIYRWSEKAFKGAVVKRKCHFIIAGSVKIKPHRVTLSIKMQLYHKTKVYKNVELFKSCLFFK